MEMKLLEFFNFELAYLAELEMMVQVLLDMQGGKTDPDPPGVISVLLSAHVKRVNVSRMRDFLNGFPQLV